VRSQPGWQEERRLWAKGHLRVAGVDEVGRGPLAGPLVAAAVVLPQALDAPWVDEIRDSKQLTPSARERLAPQIQRAAIGFGVGMADVDEIDAVGIAEATRQAMARAVRQVPCGVDHLLVDALELSVDGIPSASIVHGDAICCSIAAASIVAKVARDRLMTRLDALYPGYGFARHKGYPTPQHVEALERLGPSPLHRRRFAPVQRLLEGRRG
jgi:ribonuclease HII